MVTSTLTPTSQMTVDATTAPGATIDGSIKVKTCSHCFTSKTPLWRGNLCNACATYRNRNNRDRPLGNINRANNALAAAAASSPIARQSSGKPKSSALKLASRSFSDISRPKPRVTSSSIAPPTSSISATLSPNNGMNREAPLVSQRPVRTIKASTRFASMDHEFSLPYHRIQQRHFLNRSLSTDSHSRISSHSITESYRSGLRDEEDGEDDGTQNGIINQDQQANEHEATFVSPENTDATVPDTSIDASISTADEMNIHGNDMSLNNDCTHPRKLLLTASGMRPATTSAAATGSEFFYHKFRNNNSSNRSIFSNSNDSDRNEYNKVQSHYNQLHQASSIFRKRRRDHDIDFGQDSTAVSDLNVEESATNSSESDISAPLARLHSWPSSFAKYARLSPNFSSRSSEARSVHGLLSQKDSSSSLNVNIIQEGAASQSGYEYIGLFNQRRSYQQSKDAYLHARLSGHVSADVFVLADGYCNETMDSTFVAKNVPSAVARILESQPFWDLSSQEHADTLRERLTQLLIRNDPARSFKAASTGALPSFLKSKRRNSLIAAMPDIFGNPSATTCTNSSSYGNSQIGSDDEHPPVVSNRESDQSDVDPMHNSASLTINIVFSDYLVHCSFGSSRTLLLSKDIGEKIPTLRAPSSSPSSGCDARPYFLYFASSVSKSDRGDDFSSPLASPGASMLSPPPESVSSPRDYFSRCHSLGSPALFTNGSSLCGSANANVSIVPLKASTGCIPATNNLACSSNSMKSGPISHSTSASSSSSSSSSSFYFYKPNGHSHSRHLHHRMLPSVPVSPMSQPSGAASPSDFGGSDWRAQSMQVAAAVSAAASMAAEEAVASLDVDLQVSGSDNETSENSSPAMSSASSSLMSSCNTSTFLSGLDSAMITSPGPQRILLMASQGLWAHLCNDWTAAEQNLAVADYITQAVVQDDMSAQCIAQALCDREEAHVHTNLFKSCPSRVRDATVVSVFLA